MAVADRLIDWLIAAVRTWRPVQQVADRLVDWLIAAVRMWRPVQQAVAR